MAFAGYEDTRLETSLPGILLIDAHHEHLASLKPLVEQHQARLQLVSTSSEALLSLAREPGIALVIVVCDRVEAVEPEILRAMNQQAEHCSVLIITRHEPAQDMHSSAQAGEAVDLLFPPVDPLVLQNRVAHCLELFHYKQQLDRVNQLLEAQKTWYEFMLSAADEGVLGLSPDGRVDFANPTALRLLAAEPDRLLGQNFIEIGQTTTSDKAWEQTIFYRYWKSRRALRLAETLLRRQDGVALPVSLSCAPLPGSNGGSVIVFQDISQHKQLEEQLRLQAISDALTGLLNRHGLKQALAGAIARAIRGNKHIGLFVIELVPVREDHAPPNQEYSDQILCQVAARLKNTLWNKELIARTGNETFIAIVEDLEDAEQAGLLARKLLQALEPVYEVEAQHFPLTICIGIALFPDNSSDSHQLMLAADLAMYRAKHRGHNTFEFFTPELNARAQANQMLEQGIRQGLDAAEFVLVYQPMFDLHSMQLVGLEALIRWHRNQTIIMPEVFIRLMEQTGLIHRMEQWVIDTVAQQRQQWQQAGQLPAECPVSINLSHREFMHADFIPNLQQTINRHKLWPGALEIELTEPMLSRQPETAELLLEQLRQLGVRLAIDDLGTGYTSLARLIHYHIDRLKIDQSFVARMVDHPNCRTLCAAMIDMARHLSIPVLAEGVETQQQIDLLAQLGCNQVQGFFCAKPMGATEIAQHLPAWLATTTPAT